LVSETQKKYLKKLVFLLKKGRRQKHENDMKTTTTVSKNPPDGSLGDVVDNASSPTVVGSLFTL
jgi:hypothetical protein